MRLSKAGRWLLAWSGGRLGAALATAGVVLILRWALVALAGSAVPYWDQWDGEGIRIYMPWVEGRLRWTELFAPHNEHRPVLTHLWNLLWFKLGGGWDPLVQMWANAMLPALIAGLAVYGGWNLRTERGWRCSVMVGCVLALCGPWGHENTLWGFQSQFYFLILLSGVEIAGLQAESWRSWGWWGGLIAGICVPFTMAAGGLTGAAVASMGALQWLSGGRHIS